MIKIYTQINVMVLFNLGVLVPNKVFVIPGQEKVGNHWTDQTFNVNLATPSAKRC